MRGAQLTALVNAAPAGVNAALALVDGLDDALVAGLARPGEAQVAALGGLAAALAGTPLGDRVAEAVAKVTAGSPGDEHLAALAGARTALLGAAHDALLAGADAAGGRERAAQPAPAAGPLPAGAAAPLPAARSWLTELAIIGWRGVNHDLVAAGGRPVEAALAVPALRRLAVLLDGLAGELAASCPVATMAAVPARRWADLWARAVLLAQETTGVGDPSAAGVERVSGRLLVLGIDVHEHATAVQVQAHGVLEPSGGGPARLVRTAVAATKVDTIVGPALWRLLADHPVLLAALAERRGLEVTDLPLAGGDLWWRDGQARAGEPADPFATARVLLPAALAAPVPPLDRHPVAIAEPVLLEGYAVDTGDDGAVRFTVDGASVAVAVDRLPTCGPLTPALVAASTACLGLLRWDAGQWTVQPLAVQARVKRATVAAHNGDWAQGPTDAKVAKAEAKAGDSVAVLRERAGRLLRR
ncbi:hypothetical protein [Micromonospora sp. RTGN7]|uniref:hypothetical protein n=1 Tax=Micromonospora sp. RTGN7 TaxID=3016526 RepID=UPI0029FF0095|nr:hypothetical protein [Micromonospora sp. RTGN7]